MSDLDGVKKKINSLLKMSEANGAGETEAMNAMNIASRLMQEHGITMEDLKTNSEASKSFNFDKAGSHSGSLHIIDQLVTSSIARFTDTVSFKDTIVVGQVRPRRLKSGRVVPGRILTKTVTVFYGYSVDVELAKYIYSICRNAMEYEWSKYADEVPQGHRAKQRKHFMVGMALRLRARLDGLKVKTTGTDLVVLKRELVRKSFDEKFSDMTAGKAKTVTYSDKAAFKAGGEAANNVHFNREIHDGPTGGIKLLK